MRLRHLVILNGLIAVAWGALFTLWPGTMMPLYGVEQSFETLALTRIFGTALAGFGVLVLAVRDLVEAPAARPVLRGLLVAHLFGLLMTGLQQTAIWSSLTGGATVGIYFFFTGIYGWAVLRPPAEQGPPADDVPVEAGAAGDTAEDT